LEQYWGGPLGGWRWFRSQRCWWCGGCGGPKGPNSRRRQTCPTLVTTCCRSWNFPRLLLARALHRRFSVHRLGQDASRTTRRGGFPLLHLGAQGRISALRTAILSLQKLQTLSLAAIFRLGAQAYHAQARCYRRCLVQAPCDRQIWRGGDRRCRVMAHCDRRIWRGGGHGSFLVRFKTK